MEEAALRKLGSFKMSAFSTKNIHVFLQKLRLQVGYSCRECRNKDWSVFVGFPSSDLHMFDKSIKIFIAVLQENVKRRLDEHGLNN